LPSEPLDEVLHFDFVLYRWLLDKDSDDCEPLSNFSYPVVLLQGRKRGGDRFIESFCRDLYRVLNVPKILYRHCARSQNHARDRSIFALCSPRNALAQNAFFSKCVRSTSF
jgi:hypothetical protein